MCNKRAWDYCVATVVAETNGFILFENYKQVVSYAGYDVVENQSGNHIGKHAYRKRQP
ncbi:MAG: transposase [Bacteroidetes bacterium]|nr:transposase [Bacteroidota bacterium]